MRTCCLSLQDHALQLRNLQHLSVSTRKGLLYLVLSQRQLTDLAGMSSLQVDAPGGGWTKAGEREHSTCCRVAP